MTKSFRISSELNKKFLEIFEDKSLYYGGDQNWYKLSSRVSNGCGPVAGANALAYLAQTRKKYGNLYQYENYSKENFLKFMNDLYDHTKPKWYGLINIDKFISDILNYGKNKNINLSFEKLAHNDKNFTYFSVYSFIRNALLRDVPVLAFNLDFRKKSSFKWHWISITGIFQDHDKKIKLSASSWGKRYELDFELLYNFMKFSGGLVYFY